MREAAGIVASAPIRCRSLDRMKLLSGAEAFVLDSRVLASGARDVTELNPKSLLPISEGSEN